MAFSASVKNLPNLSGEDGKATRTTNPNPTDISPDSYVSALRDVRPYFVLPSMKKIHLHANHPFTAFRVLITP